MDKPLSFRALSHADFFPTPALVTGTPRRKNGGTNRRISRRSKRSTILASDGTEPTHVFIIEYGQHPIGWIQWYLWSDYPEHSHQLGAEPTAAGIDLAIERKNFFIGKGLGSTAILKFIEQVVFTNAKIISCIADPENLNSSSVRAFEKAGFVTVGKVQLAGELVQRNIVRLARSTISAEGDVNGNKRGRHIYRKTFEMGKK